jgi:SAM-dependent methyltransferase
LVMGHHFWVFVALLAVYAIVTFLSSNSGGSSGLRKVWYTGLNYDQTYWSQWIESRGLEWPEDFQRRLQIVEIDEKVKRLVNPEVRAGRHAVHILDAGAGPMTSLGSTWMGKLLDLRACDPLAPEFAKMLRRHKIVPPVRTVFAELEHLSLVFATNFFDLVVMREAIDHSYDPVRAIKEAIKVTRVNGTVWLGHKAHGGLVDQYIGTHTWNVDLWEGHPIIWNACALHNLTDVFSGDAIVASKSSGDWVEILLVKR